VLLLALVPIWFSAHLPAVDLAEHAAQVSALKQVLAGNEAFTHLFEIHWFTPYLVGYLLLYLLSLLLPIQVATQVLVSFAVIALPLSTGALLRAAGADERWKWLTIPGSYSFAFYWGFLTFMVAVPISLFFLVLTWWFVRQPTLRNGVLVALASLLLFFCHFLAFCGASLFALGIVAGSNYRNLKALIVRSLPYAAPLPLVASWAVSTANHDGKVQASDFVFGGVGQKFAQFLAQPAGFDYISSWLTPIVTLTVALFPLIGGAKLSRRPERWLPVLLAVIVFLALPSSNFHTGFIYERMGIFIAPLWLMAWDPAPNRRWEKIDGLAMGVILLWLFINVGRYAAFAREVESFDRALAAAVPGKKMGTMTNGDGSPLFVPPIYHHFPAWYQAEHGGIVDFNFGDFFPQVVRYRADAPARIDQAVASDLREFRWDRHGGDNYDYFMIRSEIDVCVAVFNERCAQLALVTHEGTWWLYRNTGRPQ